MKVSLFEQVPYRYIPEGFETHHNSAVTAPYVIVEPNEVPTLILWGRQDALIPVAYAADFGDGIAGSQVELIDDCGHVLQAEQPERAWGAVSKFLAG